MKKDIDKYWDEYQKNYSFEEVLKKYRERKVLDFLESKRPKKILEIGCGFTPLFLKYSEFNSYIIIEPGKRAYENAKMISANNNIICINNYFEKSIGELIGNSFDCIVCPGVLHETSTPRLFLECIEKLMTHETDVYINVPNALSLHRLIAQKMGIIENLFQQSNRNIYLQQNKIFDIFSLQKFILEVIPSAKIEECHSFFLKPFTHDQMMDCINKEILNLDVMEGLYKVSDLFKDYGCELYCTFKKNV